MHNRKPTHFKLIIDFGLERFYVHVEAEGWGSERNVQTNVPAAKSICESSLYTYRMVGQSDTGIREQTVHVTLWQLSPAANLSFSIWPKLLGESNLKDVIQKLERDNLLI